MKTIYKYPLEITDYQEVQMPDGAEVLCVMVQNGQVCLWAEVEPTRPLRAIGVQIVGTGNPLPVDSENRWYIGSVVAHPFVWHVYEVDVKD